MSEKRKIKRKDRNRIYSKVQLIERAKEQKRKKRVNFTKQTLNPPEILRELISINEFEK